MTVCFVGRLPTYVPLLTAELVGAPVGYGEGAGVTGAVGLAVGCGEGAGVAGLVGLAVGVVPISSASPQPAPE